MRRNPLPSRCFRSTTAGIGAIAAVGVLCAAPAMGTTAFTFRGTDILSPGDRPEDLLPALFAGDDVVPVDYPASIFGMDKGVATGLDNLDAAMAGVEGPVLIAGFSQGAEVAAAEKARIMALPPEDRPAADQLSFIVIGDPTGPNGILHWLPGRVPLIGAAPVNVPDTPYDTIVVNREYDGWADLPDRPLNLLADANAVLGIIYVHGRYDEADLDLSHVPADNITEVTNSAGGKTTTYLVPTSFVPLVQPLRDLGVPENLVRTIEEPLRRIVDMGYSRNDPKPVDPAKSDATEPAATPDSAADDTKPAKPRHRADRAQAASDTKPTKPERRHRRDRSRVSATLATEVSHDDRPRHRIGVRGSSAGAHTERGSLAERSSQ